ncbi:hypothetical protein ACMAZE_05425 [Pseudopelagicola sp. nBUS_20]|uniref:hypothetical protein n=1 Tax=Pseudopelagicola sp. nBUS_20 TaxID=3395317 RepID=UPI003EBDC16D
MMLLTIAAAKDQPVERTPVPFRAGRVFLFKPMAKLNVFIRRSVVTDISITG